jgi:hypothetical protein
MTSLVLLGLLEFIRRNAALGAKTNLGYGFFKWASDPGFLELATRVFARLVAERSDTDPKKKGERKPDLCEMFFGDVRVHGWRAQHLVNLKYDLRGAFQSGSTIQGLVEDENQRTTLRHLLLGTIEGDNAPQASKIKLALVPDRPILRVWGWVPRDLKGIADREEVVTLIKKQLRTRGRITRWREFDSSRDTVGRFTDSVAYLNSFTEEE